MDRERLPRDPACRHTTSVVVGTASGLRPHLILSGLARDVLEWAEIGFASHANVSEEESPFALIASLPGTESVSACPRNSRPQSSRPTLMRERPQISPPQFRSCAATCCLLPWLKTFAIPPRGHRALSFDNVSER